MANLHKPDDIWRIKKQGSNVIEMNQKWIESRMRISKVVQNYHLCAISLHIVTNILCKGH